MYPKSRVLTQHIREFLSSVARSFPCSVCGPGYKITATRGPGYEATHGPGYKATFACDVTNITDTSSTVYILTPLKCRLFDT